MRSFLARALDAVCGEPCVACSPDDTAAAPWVCRTCIAQSPAPPPPVCARCGGPLPHRDTSHRPIPVHAATAYQPGNRAAASVAVRALKFHGRRALAPPLGELMATRVPCDRTVLVVPVPLHRGRLTERGFNQAALIARTFRRRRSVAWHPYALRRTRASPAQATLGRRQRRHNLQGAFSATDAVRGRAVLLVDDVCTTGATIEHCAHAVLAAGALIVGACVVARRVDVTNGPPAGPGSGRAPRT